MLSGYLHPVLSPESCKMFYRQKQYYFAPGTWAGSYGKGGVYRTTNEGTNWIAVNSGLTDTAVFAFAVSGSYLYAGILGGGVFRSTNDGSSWVQVNTGLTNTSVYSLITNGADLYAGTGDGVYRSTNNGASWAFTGLTGNLVQAFEVIGTNIFAGTQGFGVFRSTNNGSNWTEVNTGLTNQAVQCLNVMGANLYAGTFSGVFLTSNNGASWVNTQGFRVLLLIHLRSVQRIFLRGIQEAVFRFQLTMVRTGPRSAQVYLIL